MAEIQHLCMGSMKPIHENAVICPFCGYNSLSTQHSLYLPTQTVLSGKYLVGKVISVDSDSATYIGFDLQHRKTVQIHEFLPERIITRESSSAVVSVRLGYERMFFTCLQDFMKLWRTLAQISDAPAIETVIDVFSENSTAYAVSDYIDAISLEEYFRNNPPLSQSHALSAFMPIFSAVAALHRAAIVHAAISPLTIMLDASGKLRLTGFSIAQTKSSIQELHRPPKDGYSAIELYDRSMHITERSDIYSAAAVFYTAVTGIIPPVASQRVLNDNMVIPKEIASSLSANVIDAIVCAMRVSPQERTSSIGAFKSILTAKVTTTDTSVKAVPATTEKEKNENSEDTSLSASLLIKMFTCIIAVCVIVFCTLYTTFLYKSMDIPMLNSVFSSFSFLPMNMDKEEVTTDAPTESEPITTAAQTVRVSEFVGLTYQDVKLNAVYNRNFNFEYQYEYSETYEKDIIISQSIPKGETVNQGTTITLVVSSGKAKIVLRDVIGQNYDIAYIMLTNDGFTVKKEVLKNDGSQVSNVVSTMSLVAGLEFEKGTEVTLTVWE